MFLACDESVYVQSAQSRLTRSRQPLFKDTLLRLRSNLGDCKKQMPELMVRQPWMTLQKLFKKV